MIPIEKAKVKKDWQDLSADKQIKILLGNDAKGRLARKIIHKAIDNKDCKKDIEKLYKM